MGRPKSKNKRIYMGVRVAPETHIFLQSQPEASSRVIDSLVRCAVDKKMYKKIDGLSIAVKKLTKELLKFN